MKTKTSSQLTYLGYLDEIQQEQRYLHLAPQPGCIDADLRRFQQQVREQLQIELPADYLEFLSHTNGLVYCGTVLYAIEEEFEADQNIPGVISENKVLQQTRPESEDTLLYLGYSDLWLYVYNVTQCAYQVLDFTQNEVHFECKDIQDLLLDALHVSFFDGLGGIWDE
jgi:hypothetical protein